MLIELLLVIAVGAVLIAVIIKAIDPVTRIKQARDAKRKSDINMLANTLRSYEAIFGKYPQVAAWKRDTSTGEVTFGPPNDPSKRCGASSDWSTTAGMYTEIYQKEFLKSLPKDPLNNSTYCYIFEVKSAAEGEPPCQGTGIACRYWIGAYLEKYKDVNSDFFRCSDDETLAAGTGCKMVGDVQL